MWVSEANTSRAAVSSNLTQQNAPQATWCTSNASLMEIGAGLKVLPHNAKMHYNFANYLRDTGDVDNAVGHYREALR
ncbi:hypothetical protein J437_LFUL004200 [Ladona fulva]|uniref:Uncharacterized protein n=1 Tax=Ladona fulva TaxID=123851 RepID=A0A8K0JZQ7_LADFU|nr:hypothetical protein J437_LFUL004200 [Ladona fulva]